MPMTEWWSEEESNPQQHLHMTPIFLISFNIIAAEITADYLAFRLDFPGQESVTVW